MQEATTPTETTDAPEATTTTQPEQPETFDREYVTKLREENARYRTRAKEAQEAAEKARLDAERQKLDEVERLKAEKADAEKKAAEIEARAVAAERKAALTGKVADPVAALKLLEDTHLDDEGNVLVDKLLEAYPFLAPQQDTKRVDLPGQKTMPGPKGDLTPDDFRGKDQAWIAANLHRLKSPQ